MGRKHDQVLHDFVVERSGGLRRTAFLMCGDWEVAEDLVRDIMSELVLDGRRRRSAQLDSYARRAVMDAFHDDWRRRFRRRDRFFYASGDEPLGVPDPTLKVSVLAALSDLPARRRAVMVLRHWDALSVRETADTLGIRARAVQAHDARGSVAIRESLADHPDLVESTGTRPEPTDDNDDDHADDDHAGDDDAGADDADPADPDEAPDVPDAPDSAGAADADAVDAVDADDDDEDDRRPGRFGR